jgi:alpha-tubulin suppressor-like RCC1 family protein
VGVQRVGPTRGWHQPQTVAVLCENSVALLTGPQVSAGGIHTSATKASGTLWTWGFNNSGQLGDGTSTDRCSPVQEVSSATDWAQVSAGFFHTAAVKTAGTLWTWGGNDFGQLGDGTVVARCSPVQEVSSATDWAQVSAGDNHTAATKTSGQLWAWGSNGRVNLGDGTCHSSLQSCTGIRLGVGLDASLSWRLSHRRHQARLIKNH